jgi:hypothetical protein
MVGGPKPSCTLPPPAAAARPDMGFAGCQEAAMCGGASCRSSTWSRGAWKLLPMCSWKGGDVGLLGGDSKL